jgi:hypothetical protein
MDEEVATTSATENAVVSLDPMRNQAAHHARSATAAGPENRPQVEGGDRSARLKMLA